MLYYFAGILVIFCSKIFFRLEVNGLENIPRKGGFIIASNHVSLLDPVLIGATCLLCFRKVGFMAKAELFRNKIFAWLLSNLNAFPVVRKKGDVTAVKEAIKRLKKGEALLLFPEGRRSQTGDLLSAQSGIGLLVKKARVPILPTFIKGTEKALSKGNRLMRPSKVRVYFGKLYYAQENASHSMITERLMHKIALLNR